jgi:hypothetical protein
MGADARWRRSARARLVESEADPPLLPLTRVTVVTPEDLGAAAEAARWLERLAGDAEEAEAFATEALRLANRALHAHRAAAQDPYTHEVSESQAVATRIGYGEGEQVADGLWADARELVRPKPRRRRAESLWPQERVAAVLGGRESVDPCETLLLRARLDLDQGRHREGALQLRAGLESLLVEMAPRAGPSQRDDLAALEQRRDAVEAAAESALAGDLDDARAAGMRETLEIAERILRRRRLLSD